jgi:hypothetical protein
MMKRQIKRPKIESPVAVSLALSRTAPTALNVSGAAGHRLRARSKPFATSAPRAPARARAQGQGLQSACGRGDSRTATPDLQSKAPRFGQVMGVVQLHHSFLFGSFPQLKIGRPNQCRKHKTVGVTVPQAKLIGFVVSALGRLAEDDRSVKRTCGWPLVADFAIPNW